MTEPLDKQDSHERGTPANPVVVRLADDQVVTIQRTSKGIKFWMLIAVLSMLLGALLAGVDVATHFAHPDRMGTLLTLGGIIFSLGFVIFLAARFLAWWHHG